MSAIWIKNDIFNAPTFRGGGGLGNWYFWANNNHLSLAGGASLKRLSLLAVSALFFLVAVLLPPTALAQTVINCPSGFNGTSGSACSVGNTSSYTLFTGAAASLSGSSISLVIGGTHSGGNALTTSVQNIQAFTSQFTFHAN